MKAVLFDLDDTLYPEIEFVRGGFRAAARYVARRSDLGADAVVRELMHVLERDGRGRVFDSVLEAHGLRSPAAAQAMLLLYRSHDPRIRLYRDVAPALRTLRRDGVRLGIVTDGLPSVQWRKVTALKLEKLMHVIVCTGELAGDVAKPSPVPFQVALDLMGCDSAAAAYVGNDPGKDFRGPRRLGMVTVRVRRQTHKGGIPLGRGEDADFVLDRFSQLPSVLEKAT